MEMMVSHVGESMPLKGSRLVLVTPSMETQYLSGTPPWVALGTSSAYITPIAEGPSLAIILCRPGVFAKPAHICPDTAEAEPGKMVFHLFGLF